MCMWKRFPSGDEHYEVFRFLHMVQPWIFCISSFAPKVVNGTSDLTIAIKINFHAYLWSSLLRKPGKVNERERRPSWISCVLTFTRIHDYEEILRQCFYYRNSEKYKNNNSLLWTQFDHAQKNFTHTRTDSRLLVSAFSVLGNPHIQPSLSWHINLLEISIEYWYKTICLHILFKLSAFCVR